MACIQGLTEFLPISSSGHLAIVQYMLGFTQDAILFDIILHFGTLVAVLCMLRKDITVMAHDMGSFLSGGKSFTESSVRIIAYVCIATIPAVIAGFLFKERVYALFSSLKVVALLLIINGFILSLSANAYQGKKRWGEMRIWHALVIGSAQAIAIMPGISRSGITIIAGMLCGLNPLTAFTFSFLMAIPVMCGAVVLELPHLAGTLGTGFLMYVWGFVVAASVGYGALFLLKKVLRASRLYLFSLYCVTIGCILFFIL